MTEDDQRLPGSGSGAGPDDRLDRELRAAFAPPADREFEAMARDVAATPPAPAVPHLPWVTLSTIAALLCVGLLLWANIVPVASPGAAASAVTAQVTAQLNGSELGLLWVAAYRDAADRGFEGGCCEPSFDLPAACHDEFATRVGLADGANVRICGSYCGLETGGCVAMIARAGELPMCVYIVRRADDPGVELPLGSDLRLSRRELDDLVLYALAPAPVEATLAAFVTL